MRVVMTGSGYMATLMGKAIIESGHELVAIIDNGRTVKGYRRRLDPWVSSIFSPNGRLNGIARRRGIPIIYVDKMTEEELAPLRALNPDLIVVGGFSIILKKSLITLPKIGCINCHSSLLPRHRGPNPFQAVILAGDEETGITYHVIDEGIDTGPILEQHRTPVTNKDTAGSLVRRTSQLAAEKLPALLDRIARDGLNGTPQPTDGASYDKKLEGDELFMDWERPAVELDRMVRACFPFTMARFRYKNTIVYVARSRPHEQETGRPPGTITATRPLVRVATGKGTLMIMGYANKPFPWLWPGLFWRPPLGFRLK